jgi:hypothetical protein
MMIKETGDWTIALFVALLSASVYIDLPLSEAAKRNCDIARSAISQGSRVYVEALHGEQGCFRIHRGGIRINEH